jgi:endonuclease/exonuclease/phosphatase family metal-dependent hydrolase
MVEGVSERSSPLAAGSIRIMSFNVRGSFRDRLKAQAWRNRAALNVATIKRCAPDLIGLQECQRGNLKAYKKRLPRYARVRGPRYGNAVHPDSNAILYDPERLNLLDSGGFYLSETPEKRSKSWGARVVRSANWALFGVLGTTLSLLHLNTHLDHESGLARREGSKLIIERVTELSNLREDVPAIVVTGDFNSRPGSPTYESFSEAAFVDTFLTAGKEDTQNSDTFHAFHGPTLPGRPPEARSATAGLDPPQRPPQPSQDGVAQDRARRRRDFWALPERSLPRACRSRAHQLKARGFRSKERSPVDGAPSGLVGLTVL